MSLAPAPPRRLPGHRGPGQPGVARPSTRSRREVGRALPVAVRIDQAHPGAGRASGAARATRPRCCCAADRLHGLGLGAPTPSRRWRPASARTCRSSCAAAPVGRAGAASGCARPRVPAFAALLAKPGAGPLHGRRLRGLRPPARRRRPPAATSAPPGMPALAGWVRNDLWPAALALAPALGATARALARRRRPRRAAVRQRLLPRGALPGPRRGAGRAPPPAPGRLARRRGAAAPLIGRNAPPRGGRRHRRTTPGSRL